MHVRGIWSARAHDMIVVHSQPAIPDSNYGSAPIDHMYLVARRGDKPPLGSRLAPVAVAMHPSSPGPFS